jgi:hypothetical protein
MSRAIKIWSGSTWEDVGPALPTVTTQFIQIANPSSVGFIIRGAASQTANLMQIQSNNLNPLVTVDQNGFVGIGTSSPQVSLKVTNGTSGTVAIQSTGSSGAFPTTGAGLELVAGAYANGDSIQSYNRDTSSWRTLGIYAGQINLLTSGLGRFSIDSSGNITIGSGSGTTTVNGDIAFAGTLIAPKITYSINPQTGTTYTAALTDAASIITINNASANTVSIPTNASVAFPVGSSLTIIQTGSGNTTINAVTSGTTTIASNGATSNAPKLRTQYSAATAIKIQQTPSEVWYVVGDIA